MEHGKQQRRVSGGLPGHDCRQIPRGRNGDVYKRQAQNGFAPYEGPTPFDEKPKTTATPVSEPKLTIVELRAFVAARSTPENRPKIKGILTRYGVKKLTELQESQYEAVKNEVAAL